MKKLISLLTVYLLGFSCSSSYLDGLNDESKYYPMLRVDLDSSLKSKDLKSKDEIREDIEVLIYALLNGYGGRKYVPKESLRTAIKRLREIGEQFDSISATELCRKIDQALLNIPDNHLIPRLPDKRGLCSKERARRFPRGNVGRNINRSKEIWKIEERIINNKKSLILGIKSLPGGGDQGWKGLVPKFKEELFKSDSLILDFRGLPGGSDTILYQLSRVIYGQKQPVPYEKIIKSQTKETLTIKLNGYILRKKSYESRGVKPPKQLLSQIDKIESDILKAEAGDLEAEFEKKINSGPSFDSSKGFNGNIYILVDKVCASSCEGGIFLLEGHPKMKVVGENTGGFVHFGNLGSLFLPNSKVFIGLPTDYWKFKDNRFLEFVGVQPDIRVPKGKDALIFISEYSQEAN